MEDVGSDTFLQVVYVGTGTCDSTDVLGQRFPELLHLECDQTIGRSFTKNLDHSGEDIHL